MYAVFDQKELLVLLQDFHELTGLRAVVFDAWGMDILSYPKQLPDFCRLVRSSDGGSIGCHLCDQNACRTAQKEGQTVTYACHAGLIEMITPILVEGATVGYLLLSHIVQGADEQAEWEMVQQLCSRYHIDPDELYRTYQQLPRTPYRVMKAASDLLSLSAKGLYQQRLARLVPDSSLSRLNSFLNEHLAEDLSCQRLCKELSISRTALYNLSTSAYGCGISEHITRLRIQKAVRLLTETTKSTNEICHEIGIGDYNYFFRVFRRHTGVTPKAYRRQLCAKNETAEPVHEN